MVFAMDPPALLKKRLLDMMGLLIFACKRQASGQMTPRAPAAIVGLQDKERICDL